MKTIVISFLILFVIYALKRAHYAFIDYLCEKYVKEKHFCNKCRNAFVLTRKYRKLTHCLECGEELTTLFPLKKEVEVEPKEVFEEFKEERKEE